MLQTTLNQNKTFTFAEIEELYKGYSNNAYGLALKILREPALAEDAVQDAFLRYYRTPQNYNAEKGPFLTWLLTVVRNICLDQLRKTKRRGETTIINFPNSGTDLESTTDQFAEIIDESVRIEEEVWLKIERRNIQAALQTIPAEQKKLIELAFFQGLTHKEIEKTTGIPLGTVKSRIRQGLHKLKVYLNADRNGWNEF